MQTAARPQTGQSGVALLCPEPRLRRILRLALVADDQDVVEWDADDETPRPGVSAIVADLDSLCLDVEALVDRLKGRGIAEGAALLLISIYPLELAGLAWSGPADSLQPPFSPQTLASRVRQLLDGAGQMAR